jgi:co-chaperonin GroES (HSP10)
MSYYDGIDVRGDKLPFGRRIPVETVHPLRNRVVIKPEWDQEEGQIIVPSNENDYLFGEVVGHLGPEVEEVSVGDRVAFMRFEGQSFIGTDDYRYIMLRESWIFCICDESAKYPYQGVILKRKS